VGRKRAVGGGRLLCVAVGVRAVDTGGVERLLEKSEPAAEFVDLFRWWDSSWRGGGGIPGLLRKKPMQ